MTIATATSLSPQALAEACAEAMWSDDLTSQRLGMRVEHVAPGEATLSMEVTDFMLNGHGLAHGGFIFALADSAFAFACNGYNQRAVAHQASITYMAPARRGDRLTAVARELYRQGRNGIYDVHVTNARGEPVAEFRGHSRTVKGTHLPE
jgi:acyl-CoA thioesterase